MYSGVQNKHQICIFFKNLLSFRIGTYHDSNLPSDVDQKVACALTPYSDRKLYNYFWLHIHLKWHQKVNKYLNRKLKLYKTILVR